MYFIIIYMYSIRALLYHCISSSPVTLALLLLSLLSLSHLLPHLPFPLLLRLSLQPSSIVLPWVVGRTCSGQGNRTQVVPHLCMLMTLSILGSVCVCVCVYVCVCVFVCVHSHWLRQVVYRPHGLADLGRGSGASFSSLYLGFHQRQVVFARLLVSLLFDGSVHFYWLIPALDKVRMLC